MICMKIFCSQLHTYTGNIRINVKKIITDIKQASQAQADLCIFPELALYGYPATDHLFNPHTKSQLQAAIKDILACSTQHPNLGIVIGLPEAIQNKHYFYNAAWLIENGHILSKTHKHLIPNDDIFQEKRYFIAGNSPQVIHYKGLKLGLHLCEDMWFSTTLHHESQIQNPIDTLAKQNADLFLNLSASPYTKHKHHTRYQLAKEHVLKHKRPFVYLNCVGLTDEAIFDGNSFVINENGTLSHQASFCKQDMIIIDTKNTSQNSSLKAPTETISYLHIKEALCFALKDYLAQSQHQDVVLGLSGGIDSALIAALATLALGPDPILGIRMPSRYSSTGSLEDAKHLADTLQITLKTIPIDSLHKQYQQVFSDTFLEPLSGIADENIQSRIRGNLVMLYANAKGALALPTSNKSELALGYATLYGDMCGALSLIGDLYKSEVYQLAHFINQEHALIPEASLTKAPSAELRPNQKDTDSLPDYDKLDLFLEGFLERHEDLETLSRKSKLPQKSLIELINKIERVEFKRKQASPIIKLSQKAFGIGRQVPILSTFQLPD